MRNRVIPRMRSLIVLFFILSFFLTNKITHAQTTFTQLKDISNEHSVQIKNIQNQNNITEGRFTDLKENYKLLYEGAKNQNDQLSNQISFTNYLLGIFSFLLTILGIALAWYVNRQSEKIKEMVHTVEIAEEYVNAHSKELFAKLKRDETLELLNRLIEVPEDIENICSLLLSRDLEEEDFYPLKDAYLKGRELLTPNRYYITLFMQHFPYQSLKDDHINDDVISNINWHKLENMFFRDIKNFFEEAFRYLRESGIKEERNKKIIRYFFYNYFKSRFKDKKDSQNFIKETTHKYDFDSTEIEKIALEEAPTDETYKAWLKTIL